MIVTVTPTIMDGTVVRWFRDTIPLEDLPRAESVVSASRNGVVVGGFLHEVPDEVLSAANAAYFALSRDRDADLKDLATHRRRSLFGPYEPIPAGQEAAG